MTTLLVCTTADTEILAATRAAEPLPHGAPAVRTVNPSRIEDIEGFVRDVVNEIDVVVVRLLGGRRAWEAGLDQLVEACRTHRIPLVCLGGEDAPDAELARLSTATAPVVTDAFEYMRQGGVGNTEQLIRFLSDTLLLTGLGFDPPEPIPSAGLWREEHLEHHDPVRPTVGVVFYRSHVLSGNTSFVDALCGALTAEGANALPIFCYSLRPDEDGRIEALDLLRGRIDALVVTVLASGGSNAAAALDGAGTTRPEGWQEWEVPWMDELDVPVVQGLCLTQGRQTWLDSDAGLSPLDAAMQVAIPEFDGRLSGVPFSFKEEVTPGIFVYRPDPERTRALARLVTRHARLRRTPNQDKRVGVVLSSYPTRHARIGNAVGLDTPASCVRLLEAMRDAGYDVDGLPAAGAELVEAIIAAGGYDTEFLTREQLVRAEGRLDVEEYARWFDTLPDELREAVCERWGDPPGDLYVEDGAIVCAGVRFGNVFVGIQPPRGFGENPIAIYHDPELPPTHHYLACYRWLDASFGAHALVHLGKHGTLEWLPGKSLGLSAACGPDACLGSLPLVYPFICNDPGEGVQAKRRAHAVVVDHLVPAMMRAETYDDLARLEDLCDTYTEIQALDPAKLDAVRAEIWDVVRSIELHRDLGLDEGEPDAFDDFLLHLDGYLCEIKDVRIRDGLHVLGEPPRGDQRLGLLAALLRLGAGEVPGLRGAVAAAFGLDEAALLDKPGAPAEAPTELTRHFGGPAHRASDLVDRLEDAQSALLEAMDAHGWHTSATSDIVRDVLGTRHTGVEAALDFACSEVVPRLERTTDEVASTLRALQGHYVPSGPSGSPTRGLLNVLPTGRNFYSVDPKALPSPFAYATGQRLARDLLDRHLADEGTHPETVGIVVWGTSAMRTQGDDIGEVLALLGTRPVWDEQTRRVCGLEVVPLAELGRPRIDVTVRISGFFRDAFPDLVTLMDDAVRLVASLDERPEHNFVRRHVEEELAGGGDPREATMRIFGSKPRAYGTGLLPLIDARNWRDDADLLEVWEVWGGYAYGRDLEGEAAAAPMRRNLSRVRVAVKNVDTREHDLLDSDDYFQFHGGMIAAVRALTGTDPAAYIADSSDPDVVRTRALAEEIRRVFRSRVTNPRWVASMRRHGHKGAFELAATVDYLFGYDATAHVVSDWMYGEVARRYVLDDENRDFLRRSNPWALRSICERLFEAADRKMWEWPDPELIEGLRAAYLASEADLEGAG